jgi:hypothetical protein
MIGLDFVWILMNKWGVKGQSESWKSLARVTYICEKYVVLFRCMTLIANPSACCLVLVNFHVVHQNYLAQSLRIGRHVVILIPIWVK